MRADARKNAERLMAAATAVFAERGLGVTITEVASRAGVSPGTLYNLFGGREGLLRAVLPTVLPAKLAEVRAAVDTGEDPGERFARFVLESCELQIQDPAFCDVVSTRFSGSEAVQTFCAELLDEADTLIQDGIGSGVLDPDLRAVDVQDLLLATAAILHERGGEGASNARRIARYFLAGARTSSKGAEPPLP